MTITPETAAATIRRDGAGALANLFAPTVYLRHDPALESDGPIDGAFLSTVSKAEHEAMGRALGDNRDQTSEISVNGSTVRMESRIRGQLGDGTKVDYVTAVDLDVSEEGIVAMTAHLTAEAMDQHGRVLTAGGFQLPAPAG